MSSIYDSAGPCERYAYYDLKGGKKGQLLLTYVAGCHEDYTPVVTRFEELASSYDPGEDAEQPHNDATHNLSLTLKNEFRGKGFWDFHVLHALPKPDQQQPATASA